MPALREEILFQLSRRLIQPPASQMEDMGSYAEWRQAHLSSAWSRFDDQTVTGKDVIDFGSGQGNLALYLAEAKRPRRIVGVELHSPSVALANERAKQLDLPEGTSIEFLEGAEDGMPLPDQSFDTLLAFDCMEHVMQPRAVLLDWHRVLRPGGRALLEWYPYLNPWGPHTESLIPVPWAHLVFGQRAMMRVAERIYDSPDYVPRAWDVEDDGSRSPNKWRKWENFREQGYINELTLPRFRRLVDEVGFDIDRLDRFGFWTDKPQAPVGRLLSKAPRLGELFTSFYLIELVRR